MDKGLIEPNSWFAVDVLQLYDRVLQSGPPASLEEALGRVQSSPKLYQGFAYIGSEIDVEYLQLY